MNEFLSSPGLVDSQAFALRLALAGVGVCLILLIAARILQRRSEQLQYGVLFCGVIGLLAIPALVGLGQRLSIPLFPAVETQEDEVLKVPMEMLPDLLNRPVVEAPNDVAAAPSIAEPLILHSLWILWALGFALGMIRLLFAFWKYNRALIRQPWQPAFWTAELQERLAHQLGLKCFPAVDVSPVVPMPMVIGIWRPSIVLPASSPAAWRQAQWEAVLLHEAAHIARGDHWAALAQRVAVLLFWWCPLVYPLSRRLNELRENICDDYALQGPCDQIAYVELLVESAERLVRLKSVPVTLALLDSAHGGLEARITRLLAKEKRTMTKLTLTGKLLGAGFLAAASLMTLAATAFSQGGAPATPAKKVQIKIIVDGKEIDITDFKLLDHIEAAQKKDVIIKAVVKPIPVEGLPGVDFLKPVVVAPIASIPMQVDPRIEELVKKAEAIKPGSGAEIRKALQATPKLAEKAHTVVWTPGSKIAVSPDGKAVFEIVGQTTAKPATQAFRVWDPTAGKKVIVLHIDDGKVLQVNEVELQKLIEKGIHFDFHANPAAPKAGKNVEEKKVHFEFAIPAVTAKSADKKPATPATGDLDALRRQLERITADLHELRQQLNAGKKQTK